MRNDRKNAKPAILFLCLGNICRSPLAEGVFLHLVREAGLAHRFEVDSAGTGDWHLGELPDPRARAAPLRRGIRLESRARQFQAGDFDRLDLVLAMDATNLQNLRALAPASAIAGKLHLFRSFDAASPPGASVPDPYYAPDAFDEVLDLCFAGCRGLLDHLRRERALG